MKLSLILLVIGLGHQNANDPHSYAIGVVFGKKLDRKGEHQGKPRTTLGTVATANATTRFVYD